MKFVPFAIEIEKCLSDQLRDARVPEATSSHSPVQVLIDTLRQREGGFYLGSSGDIPLFVLGISELPFALFNQLGEDIRREGIRQSKRHVIECVLHFPVG